MDDLSAKLEADNILLGYVMRGHGLDDRNENRERFVEFCTENARKVSCDSADGRGPSN